MPIYSATSRDFYHGESVPKEGRARISGGRATSVAIAALLAATAALAARAPLVRAVPALAPVYASLGLPTDGRQPILSGVGAHRVVEGARDVLVVEGRISDHAEQAAPVPSLRLAIQDAGGREIYHWTIDAPKPRLQAGETMTFRARLDAPPAAARRVFVRFAQPGDDAWMAPR